jgi:hypothetical protein
MVLTLWFHVARGPQASPTRNPEIYPARAPCMSLDRGVGARAPKLAAKEDDASDGRDVVERWNLALAAGNDALWSPSTLCLILYQPSRTLTDCCPASRTDRCDPTLFQRRACSRPSWKLRRRRHSRGIPYLRDNAGAAQKALGLRDNLRQLHSQVTATTKRLRRPIRK